MSGWSAADAPEGTGSGTGWGPLERGTAVGVALVAALRAVALLTQPASEVHAARSSIALSTGLLLAHATLYYGGTTVRARWGFLPYLGAQAAAVFAFGLLAPPLPVAVALYAALTAHAVRLLVGRWPAALVTSLAIVLFAVNTAMVSNVYRAASVALVLALVGAVVHAVAGARRWGGAEADGPRGAAKSAALGQLARGAHGAGRALTPREVHVLRLAARGARNQEIAEHLGISERTVKAHLASAYGKLGVETRAAATALATQRGLLS